MSLPPICEYICEIKDKIIKQNARTKAQKKITGLLVREETYIVTQTRDNKPLNDNHNLIRERNRQSGKQTGTIIFKGSKNLSLHS